MGRLPKEPRPRRGARSLSFRDKARLFGRIWTLCAVIMVQLRLRSIPNVVASINMHAGISANPDVSPTRLGSIIARVLRVAGREPRCLIKALVHYRMLREQGLEPVLVIGLPITATDHQAHAWIELNGHDVGPPPGRGEHVALARYPER